LSPDQFEELVVVPSEVSLPVAVDRVGASLVPGPSDRGPSSDSAAEQNLHHIRKTQVGRGVRETKKKRQLRADLEVGHAVAGLVVLGFVAVRVVAVAVVVVVVAVVVVVVAPVLQRVLVAWPMSFAVSGCCLSHSHHATQIKRMEISCVTEMQSQTDSNMVCHRCQCMRATHLVPAV
jgi:hypothetical protein